jgi:hypothetical protein
MITSRKRKKLSDKDEGKNREHQGKEKEKENQCNSSIFNKRRYYFNDLSPLVPNSFSYRKYD